MQEHDNKDKRERHAANYRAFSSITAMFKLVTDSLGAFLNFIPPINAAITGAVSLLEMGEALFLSEEDRKRRAIKVATSGVGVGLMVAAAVLIFNPATAPIAAALIVASIATSTAKEGYLWYKRHQDYYHSIKELTELQALRRSLTHPIKIDAINAKIAVVADHIEHCRLRIHDHRTSFIYNALSLVGAVLLTVAAFAVAGAIVSNPIGLGIAGVVMLGIATGYAIMKRFQSRHSNAAVAPEHFDDLNETPPSDVEPGERTSLIAHKLVDHLEPTAKMTPELLLQKDIDHLKQEATASTEQEEVNTLNTPTPEENSPYSSNIEQHTDDSEGEGEGESEGNNLSHPKH